MSRGLAAYWPFHEGRGRVAHDISPSRNDLGFVTGSTGTPIWGTDGLPGGGWGNNAFNVNGDCWQPLGANKLLYDNDSPFTYCFSTIPNPGAPGGFFFRGNTFWNTFIGQLDPSATLVCAIVDSSPAQFNADTGVALLNGASYRIAFVWNKGTSIQVYINGVLKVTTPVTSTALRAADNTLQVGALGATSCTAHFNNVRVYLRSLTPAEIRLDFADSYAGVYERAPWSRVGATSAVANRLVPRAWFAPEMVPLGWL